MGVWISAGVFCAFWVNGIKLFPSLYLGAFLFAGLGSGTSYILCQLFGDDGINVNLSKKQ